MYRKYLQSLSDQSACTQSTTEMNRKSMPSPIAEEDEENEVSTDSDSEIPEQNSLIEEASRSAAKAIIAYENISFSSSEESLCSSLRTFDPGGSGSGESEKKIVPTSFFLDDYIERERTPVFKKPSNDIRIEDSSETIVQDESLSSSDSEEDRSDIESEIIKEQPKSMNHIRFQEPQCSQKSSVINKDESIEPNKASPMKVWGPNGITRNDNEILLVKPIEESVNTPIEKLLYNSFAMTNNSVPNYNTNNTSNNEVIKVLPVNCKSNNHNNNIINNVRFRNSLNHNPIVNNYRSSNHTGRNSTRRKVTRVASQRVKFHDEVAPSGQLANSHSAARNLQWRSSNSQTQVL